MTKIFKVIPKISEEDRKQIPKEILEHPKVKEAFEKAAVFDMCPHTHLLFDWQTGEFYCQECKFILFVAEGKSAYGMAKERIKQYKALGFGIAHDV